MSKSVLILGATSSIARCAAASLARRGYSLFLSGRDITELERIAQDLRIRFNVTVKYGTFHADSYDTHLQFIRRVNAEMDGLEGVLLAFGYLGDQTVGMHDFQEAKRIIDSNYTGACSLLTHCANVLIDQGKGWIMAISSVAGDRGRQSNYIYGSAKAGLNTFLQGLRNRLYPHNIRVITVKPGFTDTAMTFGKPGMFLVASPENVAEKMICSLNKSTDTIYLPRFWKWIMRIINFIPETLFKRLKL
jgi:short-subunit dehydrogenase